MNLEMIIDLLTSNYEMAKTHDFIQKPFAYALHTTWKIVDSVEKPRGIKEVEE